MSQSNLPIIRGFGRNHGTANDADTFEFEPDDPKAFFGLGLRKLSSGLHPIQKVRLDLVDAPELRSAIGAQSTFWAKNALEVFNSAANWPAPTWSALGAENVNTASGGRVELVLIGQDKFYRIIAIAFQNETFDPYATTIAVEALDVAASINAQMLAQGAASAAFYTTTPGRILEVAKSIAASAWDANAGYQNEKSPLSFNLYDIAADNDTKVITPKIWRRLVHFATTEAGPANWEKYIARHREIAIVNGSGVKTTRQIIQRNGEVFTLETEPHNLIWYPKPSVATSQILSFLGPKV